MMTPAFIQEVVTAGKTGKNDEEMTPSSDTVSQEKQREVVLQRCQSQPNLGLNAVVPDDSAKIASRLKYVASCSKLQAEDCFVSKRKQVFRFHPGGKENIAPVILGLDFIGPCSDEEEGSPTDDLTLQRRCYYCGAIKSYLMDIDAHERTRLKEVPKAGKRVSEHGQQNVFSVTLASTNTQSSSNSNNNIQLTTASEQPRLPFCKICQAEFPVSPLVQIKMKGTGLAQVPTLNRTKGQHTTETPLFRVAVAQQRAMTRSMTASRARRAILCCRLSARTILSLSLLGVFVLMLVIAMALSLSLRR